MYTKLAREKVECMRMRISIARCEFNSCGVVAVAQIARFKSSHEFLVLRYNESIATGTMVSGANIHS